MSSLFLCIQLSFFVLVAFFLSRLLKLKKSRASNNLRTHLNRESLLDFFVPSFVGAYGVWIPEFWLLRNCFNIAFTGGKLLITFDLVTFVLDLLTQSDSKTKTIEDYTNEEITMFESVYNNAISLADKVTSTIQSAIDSNSAPSVATVTSVVNQVSSTEEVIVKLVVSADSKWSTYRLRVPKLNFHFDQIKEKVEERWFNYKSKAVNELHGWRMKYQDNEQEWITVQNQSEWEEALKVGKDMLKLHICAA